MTSELVIPTPKPVEIPPKYRKLMKTGRWDWIVKSDSHGNNVPVGMKRKSSGEERWFDTNQPQAPRTFNRRCC